MSTVLDTSLLDTLEFTEDNFLVNPHDWTPEVGEAIAYELGISLTDRHWEAIFFARNFYADYKESPTLRQITKRGGFETKEMYAMFEGGPAKLVAQLAGLSKPTGCV